TARGLRAPDSSFPGTSSALERQISATSDETLRASSLSLRPRKQVSDVRLARTAVATDAGRKRRHNEDAHVCEPPLVGIAGGMGGARAGEVASRLAAAALLSGDTAGSGTERVLALIQEANRSVYERSSQDAEVAGMGTTITVALVENASVTFG